MEEYIRERSKQKSIAVFTFHSINSDGSTSIKLNKLREALKQVISSMNCHIDMEEIDQILLSEDKFQRQALELE